MRFLVDQCLSPRLAATLIGAGHDAVHVRERQLERASDAVILATAQREQRVLLSADADFGEMLTVGGQRGPSLVLFRGDFQAGAAGQASQLLARLPELIEYLDRGAIVVVSRTSVRVREL